MIRFTQRPRLHPRRGVIAVLSAVLLIGLISMLAFAIDLGYLANSRAEAQRSADAAALAACYQLIYSGTPGTPTNLSSNVQNAPIVAGQYAHLNNICKSGPSLPGSDVVVGLLPNPNQSGGTITTNANQSLFNAVKVTVRRTTDVNGQVPTFFGMALGVRGSDVNASATAAMISNFGGFQSPMTSSGPGNLMLLPFALDKQTWDAMLAGSTSVSTDIWSYNALGHVVSGSDGIREVNLFPQGTGSPGNRGTVKIGTSNNSTATVVDQILNGISPQEMAMYPNSQLTFDANGDLYLGANPGISAGFKAALAAIIGQTRFIPIFTSVVGNGNNAEYDIVQFVGVRILDVDLTGSMNSKHLTVQPAVIYTRGGVQNTSTTTQTSWGIYSPVFLVQ